MTVYPQSYLNPKSQPWGRAVDKRLKDAEDSARLNALNTSNNLKQLNSSVDLLGRQQDILADQQSTLASQQNTLAAQQVQLTATDNYLATLSASTAATITSETVVTGPNVWYGGTMPTVTVSTSTGKLLVFVSGYVYSSSFGAALTFSIPGYISRTTQIEHLISGGGGGRLNGLASYGGKSQTGTYTQLVTGLPINTPLTVKAEMYVYNSGSFLSPSLIAQVVA